MSERKQSLSEYGILVNVKLMERSKTQAWLISELSKKLPERFFDSSILNRVLTGQVNSPSMISAINEILEIEEV